MTPGNRWDLLHATADAYVEAVNSGRVAAWGRMAHSVIDLLLCDTEAKQADPPPAAPSPAEGEK